MATNRPCPGAARNAVHSMGQHSASVAPRQAGSSPPQAETADQSRNARLIWTRFRAFLPAKIGFL